jgi:hypothetical protein
MQRIFQICPPFKLDNPDQMFSLFVDQFNTRNIILLFIFHIIKYEKLHRLPLILMYNTLCTVIVCGYEVYIKV